MNMVLITTKEPGSPECITAKKREMDAFKQFDSYQEVEDKGQEQLSSHRVGEGVKWHRLI